MTTAESHEQSSGRTDGSETNAEKRPRFWPVILLLAAFWTLYHGLYWLDLSMGNRFLYRMANYAALLLLFLVWWLTNRRISRRDRWFAFGIVVAGAAVAGLLVDKTVGVFGLVLSGMPYVITVWTLWWIVAQKLSVRTRRAGLAIAIALAWGFFTLRRFDGLNGAQESISNWRWEPTAEQIFLAEKPRPEQPDSAAGSLQLLPGDWPEFRGPARNGQVAGVRIATDWSADPPKLLWQHRVGPGWSSMTIVDGRLFTQEQRGEQEAVVCYDAESGKDVWAHEDLARFYDNLSGPGPRGTPTFADGRLYSLGGTGRLNCLDAASGKADWSRDIVADSGATLPQWGFSNSPLVVGDLVVVFAGGPADKGLLAYRTGDGEPAWSVATGKDSYSSPQLATIAGHAQVLMLTGRSLAAVDAQHGGLVWEHEMGGGMFLPIDQPQAVGDGQFLIQAGAGLALVEVTAKVTAQATRDDNPSSTSQLWASIALRPSLNDYVVAQQSIFGFDDGVFCCVDLRSGKRRWKQGRYGHGQVLLLPDQPLLVVLSETGEAVLVAANPEKHEELARFQAIHGKTWNHPVLAHGRLYVRNGEEMACYDLKLLERR